MLTLGRLDAAGTILAHLVIWYFDYIFVLRFEFLCGCVVCYRVCFT